MGVAIYKAVVTHRREGGGLVGNGERMKLIYLLCKYFGTRAELHFYDSYGNPDSERGWWLFGKWISAEEYLKRKVQ